MLEIGSIVDGKYKILNKIGQGGMSVVYLAMNERANKQWAIKEVRKDGVSNFEVVKQGLIAETDMLKKLNHPHLPSIIDVIDGEGTFLIVMDYIEGKSLSSVLKHQGAQSQEDVIEWAKQLCDVLGYLHSREKPIVYRDMKPSNVMLKPDGNVTLIDFGTAREFKSASVADTTCLGTQGYAAPEQFGGMGQTDGRTDIYCLGATMYHLVTGHNPAEPPYEMYPIRQWNPRLSSGLEEIITKCTQRNPADRYQSCAELMYALEHYKDLESEAKKEYQKKWRMFLGSAIMCGVCLIGTVGFKFASNNKKDSTYDSYIEQAQDATNGKNFSVAWDNYEKAIELSPDRGEAYLELVNDVILEDNVFEADESNRLKQILTTSHKNSLKSSDSESYYKLMYNLGNAYYYLYSSPEIGRAAAGEYYSNAKDGKTLTDKERKRAQTLYGICRYSGGLGEDIRLDGETQVSFNQFWDDLNQLIDDEYDATSDRTLAVKVYETFYQYVEMYKSNFYANGISYDEMVSKLTVVRGYLENIKKLEESTKMLNSSTSADLDRDLENLKNNIKQMQKEIDKSSVSNPAEQTYQEDNQRNKK